MSKFSKFMQWGYDLSLHRANEPVEHGFGYGNSNQTCAPCLNIGAGVLAQQADAWAKAFDREYVISEIVDEDTSKVIYSTDPDHQAAILQQYYPQPTGITAKLVETSQWCTFAKIRGFVLEKDGVRLPGMISVNLNDLDLSLAKEIARYATDYHWADDDKKVHTGPWAEVDADVVADAIRAAVQGVA